MEASEVGSGAERAEIARGGRKPVLSVRTMLLLVATCGLVVWAGLAVRDQVAPVHRWVREIRDGDVEARRQAAEGLAKVPSWDVSSSVPALAAAIGDPNEGVASIAVGSLTATARRAGPRRDPATVRTVMTLLLGALKDSRPDVRFKAAEGLEAIKPGLLGGDESKLCTDALIVALGDPVEMVRRAAAISLREVGSGPDGARALAHALAHDPSVPVRREAAIAVSRFTSEADAATLALIDALETGDPEVRDVSDSSLNYLLATPSARRTSALVPRLTKALDSPEPRMRLQAAAALARFGPAAEPAVPRLLAMLKEPDPPPTPGRRFFGDPIRSNPAGQAALALGAIGPGTSRSGEVASALIAVLRDGSAAANRKATAAEGLAGFGSKFGSAALPDLLRLLGENMGKPNPPAPSLCFAIGRIAPSTPSAAEAVEALTRGLDARDEDTRFQAAKALGGFGAAAKSALPRLRIMGESDKEPWMRDEARKAIARIEAGTP